MSASPNGARRGDAALGPDPEAFQQDLRSLVARVDRPLRRMRVACAREGHALQRALRWLWLTPLVLLTIAGLRLVAGQAANPLADVGVPLLLGVALVPALAMFAFELWRAWDAPLDRRAALAAIDAGNGLDERLESAESLLRSARQTRSDAGATQIGDAFVAAAIADAAEHARRLRDVEDLGYDAKAAGIGLGGARTSWRDGSRALGFALTGWLLLSWLTQLGGGATESADSPAVANAGDRTRLAAPSAVPGARSEPNEPTASRTEPPRDPSPRLVKPTEPRMRDDRATTDVEQEVRESRGRLGAGRPGEAALASGASPSKSAPSEQAPAPREDRPEASARPKDPKRRPADEDQAPPPKPESEDPSGSTAGRSASRGSNKNPATSDWSSKDQVTDPDDEAASDDETVEDEDEEQESRGGIQPSLRDRKPPANRDLRIGFGNRKNPDANGRGGPSEQKKSRGVASLVLGVPIPDRVKGQPNRGKTKITQERVEPQLQPADPIDASARTARVGEIGVVPRHPYMSPATRTSVRRYFLELNDHDRP